VYSLVLNNFEEMVDNAIEKCAESIFEAIRIIELLNLSRYGPG